ncbi:MAG: MFS transporter [Phycisphaerae bacterium]
MNLAASRRGRNLLFAALYFSEGAPIGYIWWAIPAKLSNADVPVDRVTALTSLLVLPWALKFLWAPLVDGWRSSRWGFRAWITAAQIGMLVTFAPLISMPFTTVTTPLTLLLVAHALCAATQDVAIDAFCIQTVSPSERGSVNGWMQVGMLLGRAVFGGAIHWIESGIGSQAAFYLMMISIGVSLGLLWLAREPKAPEQSIPAHSRGSRVAALLRSAFASPITWIGLVFAATGGAAFEGLGAMISPILKSTALSLEAIGWFFAFPVVIATSAGAMCGGYIADRAGHVRVVVGGTVFLCATVLVIAAVLHGTTPHSVLQFLLTVFYFAYGGTIAATYAMLMGITDPRVSGTQFSAFMGAQNLCESWAGRTAGALAAHHGYSVSLVTLVGISLAALLPLGMLRKRQSTLPNGSASKT